jgi:ribose-phosphate pyrophosphokinase
MKIYTRGGGLPFEAWAFPDGQPHFSLLHLGEFRECVIETAIRSADELLMVLLAKDALTSSGFIVSLDIRYLMGARMDRAIDARKPFTLAVIARQLMGAGFRRIRVLDPHSPVALRQLHADAVWPYKAVAEVLADMPFNVAIVAPDAGARPRAENLLNVVMPQNHYPIIECTKVRNSTTGALSGFQVLDRSLVKGRHCLIVDDICDGGGTFVGLAKELAAAGAEDVDLYVTHGIFSKSLPLEGIRRIYTTDSFADRKSSDGLVVLPIEMRGEERS